MLELNRINSFMIRISRVVLPSITSIIPLLLLTVLNVLLVYCIRKSSLNVRKLGYINPNLQHGNEKKVTKLVAAIVITFYLFNIPSAIVAILMATVQDGIILKKLYGLPSQTTNNLVVLSKVINFFLYFCCSSKFRNNVKRLWKRICVKSLWEFVSSRTNSIILSLHKLSMN